MNAIYEAITSTIIEKLEAGVAPWRKPWTSAAPRNLISDQPYRGLNALTLAVSGQYASPYWLTYKQAQERGGNVRKGEKGTRIAYYRRIEDEDDSSHILLRYYVVFNTLQCDGIEVPPGPALNDHAPIAACEAVLAAMTEQPVIIHGGDRAAYFPDFDHIAMPLLGQFSAPAEYYAALFHEIAHWTAHASRLNRPLTGMGSSYSFEELIAELAAAMLCGECGIAPLVLDNSAAYVGHWLAALKDDRRLLMQAASAAQKAADFIRSKQQAAERSAA